MKKKNFDYFFQKAIDWWFRVSTLERLLIKSGVFLLVSIYGGIPLIFLFLRLVLDVVPDDIIFVQNTIDTFDCLILTVSFIMIFLGACLGVFRYWRDERARSKKKNLVVEARGLRDDDGSPLAQVVEKCHDGKVIPILLDLRNRMDGILIDPENALDQISATHRSVLQHQRAGDRAELTTFYGGLTPVPYTFLTGVLFDDEGGVVTYDWDRSLESWRMIEGEDDGVCFKVDGIDLLSGVSEVVISLAYSYPITDDDIETSFHFPVIRLTLEEMSSDAHWSQKKQCRLAQHFFECIKQLSAKGVKRLHLVMAAPNSVVFTFGRRYDKRNLPEIAVYQYERGRHPAYPWAVLMPVAGVHRAEVIHH